MKLTSMELRLDCTFPRIQLPRNEVDQRLYSTTAEAGVCGSPELSDQIMCRLVRDVSMIIVSVDYRLAPEVVFPGPLDDCVNATKYFINHAHEFGVDSGRVAIAGGSAGGNLAAAAAIKLRDDGQV